jgi:valyl-tRNA synthetase
MFDEKDKNRPVYSIDTPPPYTSGTLHMGHVSSYCFVDFVARYKRMKGLNVFYPQGWDMQGFPTEKATEKKYGTSLGRTEFYEKCSELAASNLSMMKRQMQTLGFSFDERYEYMTMSKEYRAKVQLSLLMMHEKGMVYRDKSPVEWCTKCRSAIAHAETEDKTAETTLAYLKFPLVGSEGKYITIATTRPEFLHAIVAVAVNPKDSRFKGMAGKKAEAPIFGSVVEIIEDEEVDMSFGTGAEMVCTFGDKADRVMYYKHKLNLIEAIDENGMLKNAKEFTGKGVHEAREEILTALEKAGAMEKREQITHTVKIHDRCSTEVELIISTQWFIKILDYKNKIIELSNEMKWVPEFTKQYLEDWAKFIDWDWLISRNRVFGTPIPFWYCEKCSSVVAPKRGQLPVDPAVDKPPVAECPKCGGALTGEAATCDVWVDSSITPLVIAGWPDKKEMFKDLYPASLRVQGTEIIRTWAFYTIFRSWVLTGSEPFESVLINGMILGLDGKRMHKSKGNGVSPDDLLEKYPVDAIRLWAALSGAIGKDKQFLYNDIEYAKSFITKLFNSALFVKGAMAGQGVPNVAPDKDMGIFDIWVLNRLNSVIKQVSEAYEAFNFYDAATMLINFYWHEFCDYYIENVKHRIYSEDREKEKSRNAAVFVLYNVLSNTLKMLAPIAPHAAEEANSLFSGESVTVARMPEYKEKPSPADYVINGLVFGSSLPDMDYENAGAFINGIISDIRKQKSTGKIALNHPITSININVPEEYYKATEEAKEEIKQICKSLNVQVSKGPYSVTVNI